MGLDMYLWKRVKEPVDEQFAYWRKANAIHAWFVDNVQDGNDDQRDYKVSIEQLQELLDVVDEVLNDREKASELLPTRLGFFFGSDEYDEYYFKDLEDTKDILERAIADGGHFRYGCWW
jgi:hypothetical protein